MDRYYYGEDMTTDEEYKMWSDPDNLTSAFFTERKNRKNALKNIIDEDEEDEE